MSFKSELRAEEGRGDGNSDRCGMMERDRWEEGRESEMGRNIPLNL